MAYKRLWLSSDFGPSHTVQEEFVVPGGTEEQRAESSALEQMAKYIAGEIAKRMEPERQEPIHREGDEPSPVPGIGYVPKES